jgi:hypothetical protein
MRLSNRKEELAHGKLQLRYYTAVTPIRCNLPRRYPSNANVDGGRRFLHLYNRK